MLRVYYTVHYAFPCLIRCRLHLVIKAPPECPETQRPNTIYGPNPKSHTQKDTKYIYNTKPSHCSSSSPSSPSCPLITTITASPRSSLPCRHLSCSKIYLQKRLTLYRLYRRPCYKKVLTVVGSACTCFDKLLTLLLGVPLPVPGTLNVAAPSLGVALPSLRLLIESVALMSLMARNVPLLLISLLSILRAFQPSSSRSSRSAFSFSSRNSRSARFACSWFVLSEDCSSSIVARRLPMRSRDLAMSSASWAFTFSRRSIWDWRSLTVRSTLRTERASVVREVSRVSTCCSSWKSC